jgi:SulP family sulfate permease
VLFDLRDVPAMDMTGLVALETALDRLARQDIRVVIAGIQNQPLRVMARAHLHRDRAHVFITGSFNMGVDIARKLAR